jgi:transcriptional regulator with GAF, ATPase, and Fis domain
LNVPAARDNSFAQLELRQEREKRQFIEYALRNSKSIIHAAQRLGMKPSSLNTLISRYGMRGELNDRANSAS